MKRSCVLACCLSAFLHANEYGQAAQSPDAEKQDESRSESVKACKAATSHAVDVLQNVGIDFTVKVDWSVPGLPRVTGEKGFIYLEDGKVYYRFERTFPPLPRRPVVVELEEISYDGRVFYLGKNSKGATPSIITMIGDNPENPQVWQNYTKTCLYLEAAGFQLPRKVAQWKGGRLTSIVLDDLSAGVVKGTEIDKGDNSLVLKLEIPDAAVFDAQKTNLDLLTKEMKQSNTDAKEIQQQIAEVKALRTSGRRRLVELRLDPKRNYALVRRIESTPDGKPIYDIAAHNFEQFIEQGIWLPKNATIKTYVRDTQLVKGFENEPNRIDVIELQNVSFQRRSDVSFELNYGPGTDLTDRSSLASKSAPKGELNYRVPGSLADLRHAATTQRRRQWFITINVALLVLLIALLVRKHFFNRSISPQN